MRVAMPDANCDDSSQTVQIAFAAFTPHVLHIALDEHDGLFVIEKNAWIQKFLPHCQDLVRCWSFVRFGLVLTTWHFRFIHKINPRSDKLLLQDTESATSFIRIRTLPYPLTPTLSHPMGEGEHRRLMVHCSTIRKF